MGLLSSIGLGNVGGFLDIGDLTGANQAADASRAGNQNAVNAIMQMYNQSTALNKPFLDNQLLNLNKLQGELGGYNPNAINQSIRDAYSESPGLKGVISDSIRDIEGTSAAGRNLFSGKTGEALRDAPAKLRMADYQNFSNNYRGDLGNRMNLLRSLSQSGANRNQLNLNSRTGQQQAGLAQGLGDINSASAMSDFNTLLQGLNVGASYLGGKK